MGGRANFHKALNARRRVMMWMDGMKGNFVKNYPTPYKQD